MTVVCASDVCALWAVLFQLSVRISLSFAVLWIRNYFFPDPDPTLPLISDPDPACL